jgi:2-hydroxychromene-2-carboxylate isomerase
MATIDYHLMVSSPWIYLAGLRPFDIAARHGVPMNILPVDFSQVLPRTGGQALADRHESRKAYRLQELARWSAYLNLPLNLRPTYFPVNPAPASFALIAAAKAGEQVGPFLHRLGRAVWAEDRDIADDGVIADCLKDAGLSASYGGWTALAEAETLARNTENAIRAGVFGVPFWIVGEERFWGQDRLDMLDRHLASL